MTKTLVFAPIAQREVDFYLALIPEILADQPGTRFEFISFYQPGNAQIRKAGHPCHDIFEEARAQTARRGPDWKDWAEASAHYESEFGLGNMQRLILHEKVTFNLHDDAVLLDKFARYLDAHLAIVDRIAQSAGGPERVAILQELGGFIAPLSLYFAAKKRGIRHVFFEPAFFKGRTHFVLDRLSSIEVDLSGSAREEPDAVAYLEQARRQKTTVIPKKDRHHFREMSLSKIANLTNASKLGRKLKHKYWDRQQQEYDQILNHSLRAGRMYLNRKLNTTLYSNFSDSLKSAPYVYFPFHVQADYSLTVRSPEYLDQLGVVRYLADVLPAGFNLLIKEHPASIGGYRRDQLAPLLDAHPNLKILHPSTSSYDVLEAARAVVTINSKVGAEALMFGKPVIALGDSFYSASGLVQKASGLKDLEARVSATLRHDVATFKNEKLVDFFSRLWRESVPAELYDLQSPNVQAFSRSISQYLGRVN